MHKSTLFWVFLCLSYFCLLLAITNWSLSGYIAMASLSVCLYCAMAALSIYSHYNHHQHWTPALFTAVSDLSLSILLWPVCLSVCLSVYAVLWPPCASLYWYYNGLIIRYTSPTLDTSSVHPCQPVIQQVTPRLSSPYMLLFTPLLLRYCGEDAPLVVIREWRYSPRRLRVDDDDDDLTTLKALRAQKTRLVAANVV